MDKDLLEQELMLFGDWLFAKHTNQVIKPHKIPNEYLKSYLLERPEFAKKQKQKWPLVYDKIIP